MDPMSHWYILLPERYYQSNGEMGDEEGFVDLEILDTGMFPRVDRYEFSNQNRKSFQSAKRAYSRGKSATRSPG